MKRSFVFSLLLAIIGFLTACTPLYRQTFNDEGTARGWTQKQTDAAFAYADRTYWSREVGDNKYVIVYGKIPTSKVREQMEGVLKDLDGGLDPKNAEMAQYLQTFKLRKDMEHDEEIAEAIYERLKASELETQFKQGLGDIPSEGPEADFAEGYNVKKIYLAKSMVDAFPFKSEQIEAAKKNGTLKVIQHATVDLSSEYDHKVPNPDNPDDQNDFKWQSRHEALDLTNYKIVDTAKPLDNHGNYIEGYRIIEGKKESRPALKVFFPEAGGEAIVLVDTDEEGQPGFGIPDILENLSSETDVSTLINNGTLLDELFTKKEKKAARVVPENKLFKIEIQPLGAPVDEWTKAPDANGWIVPFKYASDRGDNYNVRVHFKKPDFSKSTDISEVHAHSEYMEIEYMEIEYIEKEYTRAGERYEASSGQVNEYYRPSAAFAGKVKAKVETEDSTKKLSFEFEDGSIVEGFVTPGKNKFIEEAPYAKSYTEGEKRWWIEKSAGSSVYDKRKGVGKPKEQTGEYGDDSQEDQFKAYGAQSRRGGDGEMIKKAPHQQ
jgi:hypothetical protein